MIELSDKDFSVLQEYMQKNYGIDLSKKRSLIQSRLSLTLSKRGFASFSDYISKLVGDKSGAEASQLVSKLTTNYTYFMREEAHFKFLTDVALGQIMPTIHDKELRTWSAGCASGEEPYTMAMVYDAHFGVQKSTWRTPITATDISDNALTKAKAGIYEPDKMTKLPAGWDKKYFKTATGGNFEITPKVRADIEFKKFNLMEKNFTFRKKFHVIFCRNVMIYFNTDTRRQLVNQFYDVLEPGGYLFIGMSESILGLGTKFNHVCPAVYRK